MTAVFFLSTGRCGTQWVTKNLDAHYADQLIAFHEPLVFEYLPRQMFAGFDPNTTENADLILEHARKIELTIAPNQGTGVAAYVECGWPVYAAIPYFLKRFGENARVVHLVRHPVPTTSSMMTHKYYQQRSGNITEKALLTPSDAGVRLGEYADNWDDMELFERCLYFWGEINAFGLELEQTCEGRWLRLRFEDLFGGNGLERLLDFMKLPVRDDILKARDTLEDNFHAKTRTPWDVNTIKEHPRIIEIAKALGYDPLDFNPDAIKDRYQAQEGERFLAMK